MSYVVVVEQVLVRDVPEFFYPDSDQRSEHS